ncbi:DUF721 domain-containing protein [Roseivivax sp.]
MTRQRSTTRGFQQTASLLKTSIRRATETRGFSQSRVLTHWEEIAGPETARIARPVEVSYGRGGLGATLVLLTTGANAPQLEMQKEQIRTRVNQVYGFNAIQKVRITQTAPTGFAEGQVRFAPAPKAEPAPPDPKVVAEAQDRASDVGDEGLRVALERLATNVLSRNRKPG